MSSSSMFTTMSSHDGTVATIVADEPECHRLLMRFPIVFSFRHALQRLAGANSFAFKFCKQ